ncbi:MAG TPA: adenylosuccinate synthase [Terriglobia bacterium]|nr:adenylosuccinate synthase [Terriglobia bacterium]
MKKNLAVVGVQWGDEGKGKIVDILSANFSCVARYQGGHNAGHTVKVGSLTRVLHLIPSGIFHADVHCVIGNGVALDPEAFLEECAMLEAAGTNVAGRLFISNRCHLILPYHRAVEGAMEQSLGEGRIGTTSRGIGPAYEDKAGRRGLRVCDLLEPEGLDAKIRQQVDDKNRTLRSFGATLIDPEPICSAYSAYGAKLRAFVVDTSTLLNGLIRAGKTILFEGAQGTLLDLDHGTFPFVTSSSAAAGGAATGLGIAPKHVHAVMGVAKAYTTRVGSGPFPTEAEAGDDARIRERGREFGATTGRPRRCGWFDGPAARYAAAINGLDSLAVTKLDVLDTFAEIPFCVGYTYKGSPLNEFPPDAATLSRIEPQYRAFKGWTTSTSGIREWKDLPKAAQDYLKHLSEFVETPIAMVSTGAERDDTILIKN